MRNVPPFRCPSCGDNSSGGDRCLRCGVLPVDMNGLPSAAPAVEGDFPRETPKPPGLEEIARPISGLSALGVLVALHAFFDVSVEHIAIGVAALGAVALAVWLARRARRSTVRRDRARSRAVLAALRKAPKLSTVGAASRYARIHGRVRVIEPVVSPTGARVGAFRSRSLIGAGGWERVADKYSDRSIEAHVHYGTTLIESCKCGRFAVDNGTGIAIVDEDAVEVWVSDDVAAPRGGLFDIAVNEGDEVEVVGPGGREPVRDESLVASDYRGAAGAFVFDGRPEDRVYVLLSSKVGRTGT